MKYGRRSVLFALVSLGALLGSVQLASPAAASNVIASANCNASSNTPVSMYVGETLTVNTSGLCTRLLGANGGFGGTGTLTYVLGGSTLTYPIGTGGTPGLDNPSIVIYTGTVVGGARVEIRDSGGGGVIQAFDVTVSAVPGPQPSNIQPESVLQQFDMPVSGTCDAVAPIVLNWGGAGSGGWGNSWAEWMNGGNGGAVCTRTLIYSNAVGHWVVG